MNSPVRPGKVIMRLALAVVFVGIAAVLVVEGILVHQLGQGKPLVGRVTGVDRGEIDSMLSFFYVTLDGRDQQASCRVPTAFVDQLSPGRTLDIYQRAGLRRNYACVAEGIALLQPEGTRSIYWGVGAGLLALLMIALLFRDFWRYSQTIEARAIAPATDRRAAGHAAVGQPATPAGPDSTADSEQR
ncbi:MAG: hypothetical protein MJE77_27735 [Proteobacteria bacterium]|nr:hypothetical protein [Pseudomonadota bacterium]